MISTTVRDATALDAEAMAHVEVATWRASYEGILPDAQIASMTVPRAQARWLRTIGMPRTGARAITLVAEREGEVIGFASGDVRLSATPRMAKLEMLYVLPTSQRLGVGRALLRAFALGAVEAEASSMWLDVLAENLVGRRFYRAMGGIELERTWRYWGTKAIVQVSYGWSLPSGLERIA